MNPATSSNLIACPVPSTVREPIWPLTRVLMFFGTAAWILRMACQGTAILGDTGSAKSSSSAKAIIHAFAEAWFGFLFLSVKKSDPDLYEAYLRRCGREQQIVRFESGKPWHMNPFEVWRNSPVPAVRDVRNMVALLEAICDAVGQGEGQRDQDPFWPANRRLSLGHFLQILVSSGDPFSFEEISDTCREAYRRASARSAGQPVGPTVLSRRMKAAVANSRGTPDERAVDRAVDFINVELVNQPEKTRESVRMVLISALDAFSSPLTRELFGAQTPTNVTAEHIVENGICLIVGDSIQGSGSFGILSNAVWKFMFEKTVENRVDSHSDSAIPVALIMDECQILIAGKGMAAGAFQSTARSQKCCTLSISQNLPNLYAQIGSPNAENIVLGWLNNHTTFIFHRISEQKTAEFACHKLGRSRQLLVSGNDPRSSLLGGLTGRGASDGTLSVSSHEDFNVPPARLLELRAGSVENDFLADAYVVFPSLSAETGRPYVLATFSQRDDTADEDPAPRRGLLRRIASRLFGPAQPGDAMSENDTFRSPKLRAAAGFKDQILAWRAEGLDLRAIAAKVNASGCTPNVDHNVIARLLTKLAPEEQGGTPASAPASVSPGAAPNAVPPPSPALPGPVPAEPPMPAAAVVTAAAAVQPTPPSTATENPPLLWPGLFAT